MQDVAKRECSRKVLKVDTAGGQIRRKENTVFFHCTASYLNVKGFSVKGRKLLSNGRRDPQLTLPLAHLRLSTYTWLCATHRFESMFALTLINLKLRFPRLVFLVDIDFKSSVSASLSSSAFVQFYFYSFPWNYFTDVCNFIQIFSNLCDNYRYVATFRSPI